MIATVTGPPGAGKSFYAVRKAVDAVESGRYLVTNFPLVDGWEEIVARHHVLRWMIPGRRRAIAQRIRERSFYTEDVSELARLRFAGTAEGRAVAIVDEAHNFMNARTWNDAGRLDVVRFFTQHRKVGLDVYLITQDLQNIDRQVRGLLEYHVTLRNLRRMKVMGVPVSPVNCFLAVWQWHSAGRAVVKREVFALNYAKRLYDTHGTSFGFEAAPPDAIWLPRGVRGADPPAAPADAHDEG